MVLWQEAEIARERVNGRIATDATLIHAVVTSVVSTDASAAKHLQKLINGVANGR